MNDEQRRREYRDDFVKRDERERRRLGDRPGGDGRGVHRPDRRTRRGPDEDPGPAGLDPDPWEGKVSDWTAVDYPGLGVWAVGDRVQIQPWLRGTVEGFGETDKSSALVLLDNGNRRWYWIGQLKKLPVLDLLSEID